MKNELVDKSKGDIKIINHKIFKGVKEVFRDSKKIFSYTCDNEMYNILPCNNNFYYINDIKMNKIEFNKFIENISM
jgi:hypothetical protein